MFEPIDDIEFTPGRRRRTRDALVQHVELDLGHRRKRRPWRIVLPAVLIAGIGVTAGIALLAPVTEANYVHCLARAELGDDGSYPGTRVVVGSQTDDGPIAISDAIAACTQVWRDGGLDADDPDGLPGDPGTPPPPPDPDRDSPVPPELTVCVLRDGSAAVVPGDRDVCLTLGLPNRLE